MKIDILGTGIATELDFPISATVKIGSTTTQNPIIKDLLKVPAYDATTGVGRIEIERKVGKGKSAKTVKDYVVFLKEPKNGLIFPIIIEDGKDALMAMGIIEKPEGTFRFQTTTTSKTSNPSISVEDSATKMVMKNALSKFGLDYTNAAKQKQLDLLFRANTRNDSLGLENASKVKDHLSYIKLCIPVTYPGKTKGTTKPGTIIIVGGNNDKRRTAFFVEGTIDATTDLYDMSTIGTLNPRPIRQIIVDKTDKSKMDIKFDGETVKMGYDTTRAFNGTVFGDIIGELNHYSPASKDFPALGDSYAEGRFGTGTKSAYEFKYGFNATMTDGKKTIDACVVVGPKTSFADEKKKQYVVYGATKEKLNALGLTSEEFACLLARKSSETVDWIEQDGKQFVQTDDGAPKEVTGIFADGILKPVWDKKKNQLVVIPKQKNAAKRYFNNLFKFLGFKAMTPKDASGNPVATKTGAQTLFDGMASAGVPKYTIDGEGKNGWLKMLVPFNPKTLGGNRALRIVQKGVSLILAAGIAGGVYASVDAIVDYVKDGNIANQTKIEQQMEATFYRDVIAPALDSVKGAKENAKNKAIIGFVNQSDRAVEFGREQANLNSEGFDIAGDQLIDGTFKTQLGKVVSGGLEALPNDGYSYSYNVYGSRAEGTLSDEEKQAGYQLFEHDGGYYLVEKKDGYDVQISGVEYQVEADETKPEEYQAVITTETAELSTSDITDAHKVNPSYVIGDSAFDGYVGYTAEGFFSQLGENAAKSALSKKSGDSVVFPIMTIDSAGNKEVVKFREAGLEDKIKKACRDMLIEDGMNDEAALDANAEVLAQFGLETFDSSYASYIDKEYDDQKIHGSGVSDERDILASEDVQKAAMDVLKKLDISSSGVNVIPTEKDGVYYLQPTLANGSASEVLVRVEGIASLQELANGLKNASKDDMEVYYSAAERYKSVYSNTDSFKGIYSMRGTRKDNFDSNGNLVSTYTTKAVKLTIDEEGNITSIEEKDGYTVKSVGGMDDTKADIMAVYGLFSGEENKKGKANFEGRSNYTIVESEKAVETASEKAGQGK